MKEDLVVVYINPSEDHKCYVYLEEDGSYHGSIFHKTTNKFIGTCESPTLVGLYREFLTTLEIHYSED